uniref:Uncharacterized protein n=1 Tax=Arundo donax TaxID=35708 RepID=A0A0A8Z606_ARUDO
MDAAMVTWGRPPPWTRYAHPSHRSLLCATAVMVELAWGRAATMDLPGGHNEEPAGGGRDEETAGGGHNEENDGLVKILLGVVAVQLPCSRSRSRELAAKKVATRAVRSTRGRCCRRELPFRRLTCLPCSSSPTAPPPRRSPLDCRLLVGSHHPDFGFLAWEMY